MKRIIKGMDVQVIAGVSKGKVGKVIEVVDGDHVVVTGVNLRKLKSKSNKSGAKFVDKEVPIHISNVMYYDSVNSCRSRVAYSFADGKKYRVSKVSGEMIK